MIHKKYIFIILLFAASNISAQFQSGKHTAGPSVGFSFLGSTIQLGINHEYGFTLRDLGIENDAKIGIGGIFRYWSYSEVFPLVEWSYSNILIGAQANYHFMLKDPNFDPWAGIILAYDFGTVNGSFLTSNIRINDPSNGGLWFGAQAGLRFWINNQMALSLRLGFGTLSYGALDIGLDYAFN
ncbi:MAG: hypothetical protein KDC52_09030 [Ignavibacteriae bacterium]|nr:hypothetical protein [Ignavibacteriota bacterium]